MEIEFGGPPPVDAIRAAADVDHVEAQDHRVRCTVHGSFAPLMNAIAGREVVNLTSHEPSLEEVFLTYYRDGTGASPVAMGAPKGPAGRAQGA